MTPLTLDEKSKIQERWSFKFTLQTAERMFTLHTSSHDERLLWIHSFSWIIEINYYYTHLLLAEAMK